MDILSYVAELIQTHKEVGIPQVGTFFKKKSPGRYDAERHSFLPPSYLLDFKPEVTEETSLVEYISKQHNLSSESAQYHIDKFAAALNKQLAAQQQADLKSLGKLVLVDGALQYEANPELNLGYEFYGLPPVHEERSAAPLVEEVIPQESEPAEIPDAEKLEAIIIENEIEEENPGTLPEEPIYKVDFPEETEEPAPVVATATPVIMPVVETTSVNVPQTPEPIPAPAYYAQTEAYYPSEEPKKGFPAYAKVIIGLLILLIAAFAFFLLNPGLKDNFGKQNRNAIPAHVPSDSVATKQEVPASANLAQDSTLTDSITNVTVPADQLSKDTVVKTTAPVLKSPAPNQPVTFEVIGSSVYGEQEAANFIAAMKRKWGINAKIVSQRPGKKIKISIATYKDEKTARAERARLEEKINIPGLYIYVNTHKPE